MSGGVGSRRQLAQLSLRDGGDLRDSVADVDVGLEEDLDDADAVQRLRLDVLDVVDGGGQRPLALVDDAVGHLFGREAGVLPDDGDDRDVDVREDVGRRVEDSDGAENHQQQRKDSEGIRPSKREADYPHIFSASPDDIRR